MLQKNLNNVMNSVCRNIIRKNMLLIFMLCIFPMRNIQNYSDNTLKSDLSVKQHHSLSLISN